MVRKTETGKPFGRTAGSLNAPIAAFTMAFVLLSYCVSSIHSARREAAQSLPATTARVPADKSGQSWVQQALQEAEQQKESK
ncbi:uncharacterized protein ACLA_046010 [Aspergillus clavatus NRRL 1]|uniref:Uncharacterized protein n=1 Tax=Aspergillus clavatus (strain ATCC 1007 / CBS 513.65 / DSM 816 / NCTC 3887 / NRRL 1 / QM 1276 / 107) TaxID=344612 RepID=A1CGY1_ASPCL|nr:uncharacterized protein ACLA_046010 [Aspergillus clavatus NRRL 1]EAW10136.1 hypothetical protein ACLA_046010 [Aspergillus clavatus NRRL 1]